MNNIIKAPKAVIGEIIAPGENFFKVSYLRYGVKYWEDCESVEKAISFLANGREYNQLSDCDSEVKNKYYEIVLTQEQVQEKVDEN